MDTDHKIVLLSAIRYGLGRSSYAVGAIIDYTKKYKSKMTEEQKQVIERDITEHFVEWPESEYKEQWLDLINYIKQ